jgi:hypothetical protein
LSNGTLGTHETLELLSSLLGLFQEIPKRLAVTLRLGEQLGEILWQLFELSATKQLLPGH